MQILINGYTVSENIKIKCDMWELDRYIGYLRRNKKRYMRVVMLLALIIPQTTLSAFASGSIIGIGLEIYEYVKDAVYVVCLLGAATEGMKCVMTGTLDQLSRVAVKYTAFALMIKFLPNFVDKIFGLGGK